MIKPVEPKKEAVKVEAVPAKVEAPAAVKAESAKKAAAPKKTAAKKAPAKKAAAPKKAAAKKAPAAKKPAAGKAAKKGEDVIVQFNGANWSVADVKAKVAAAAGKGAKNVSIYVNVVEGVAYYTVDGKDGGSVAL